MKGKNNPRWSGGMYKKHCIICGKDIFTHKSGLKRKRFCSRACVNKYLFTGNKNVNWKGGIIKDRKKLKETEGYKKWRLKVYQRDRFTCRWCGHRGKKSKAHGDKESDIHAHHIIPLSINIKLCLKEGNGITLCVKCHRKTYDNELKFVKVFKEILRDYTPNIPKGIMI